jgi:hypothetical protein
MSWIKPNFLWMMYRSGWGTKAGQEMTLALRLRRAFFEQILAAAVPSSFEQSGFSTEEEWRSALEGSEVRLQWDPDHGPHGERLERRAIQLGLSGSVLEAFGRRELLEVIDLTDLVAEQRAALATSGPGALRTPVEHVWHPTDRAIAERLKLD